MNDLCCEEVVTLRTKVNIFQGVVGILVTISLVMFTVAYAEDTEQKKDMSQKMDVLTEKVHKIDLTLQKLTTIQETIIKQLENHRRRGDKE